MDTMQAWKQHRTLAVTAMHEIGLVCNNNIFFSENNL